MGKPILTELFSLEGKSAVVTGGYGFLGRVMTLALADVGADVYVLARDEAKFNRVFSDNDGITFVECDVSETESVRNAFEVVSTSEQNFTVLVNNAYYGSSSGNFDQESDIGLIYSLDGTIGQTYRVIREAIPLLKQSRNGRIVNISSMYASVSPIPDIYDATGASSNPIMYGAGKAAVEQMTRYLAVFLAKTGITVNAIAPGPFPNPEIVVNPLFEKRLAGRVPMKRVGVPDDLISTILFLCGDGSRFVTGQVIHVDGGWTIV